MEDFLEFWLEDIMRPEMTDPSYVAYRNETHQSAFGEYETDKAK